MKKRSSPVLFFFLFKKGEKARIWRKLENCVYGEEGVMHIYINQWWANYICCPFKTLALSTSPICPIHLYKIILSLVCNIFALILPKSWLEFFSTETNKLVYCFKLMNMPLTRGKDSVWKQIMWPCCHNCFLVKFFCCLS